MARRPKATIRDLLGHTAGLADPPAAFFERLNSAGAATPRRFIAATPKPGPRTTNAEYSNTGFMIAGLILARAAGQPVAAAMRQELFGHPGGDGLAFQPAERPHPPLAHSYWHPDGTLDRADATDGSGLLPFREEATMAFTAGAPAQHAIDATPLEPSRQLLRHRSAIGSRAGARRSPF